MQPDTCKDSSNTPKLWGFYGFDNLRGRDEIMWRRRTGRVGIFVTTAAALTMGWLTMNAPLFEVVDSERSNPIAMTSLEAAARAPKPYRL